MASSSRDMVSAEQDMRLVGAGDVLVPLAAGLSYSRTDPYAVIMAFKSGDDGPVIWAVARDLLAAALEAPAGDGDIRAWPSGPGRKRVLNIELTSPYGRARFEADAASVREFLARTYRLVPAGHETEFLSLDAELAELLSQQ